jgi:hypothetical protein
MSDAASHFGTEAGGTPAGPGRYVRPPRTTLIALAQQQVDEES